MGGIDLSIRGLQEAQQANQQMIMAMQPRGAAGEAVRQMLQEAHRTAVILTPWDTGSLRAAQEMQLDLPGLRGEVHISSGARNPRSKTPPREYGAHLHAQGQIPGLRGGVRAFYAATVEQHGPRIINVGEQVLRGAMP